MRARALGGGAAALLLLVAGCRPQAAATLVHGHVSYQGRAVPRGSVVFVPDSTRGSDGPMAHAAVGADGTYDLRAEDSPSVAPGWYRVTIVAVDVADPIHGTPPRPLLPAHYQDPALSGLTCEVKPAVTNTVDFNLQ